MIIFEKAGLLTTVQDLGRTGYQRFGMPVSGVMDAIAMRLANILVGNKQTEAVLEITLVGPSIHFEGPGTFAVCGGDFSARLDGVPIENNRAWSAPAGALLELSAARTGARAYIAFAGGLDIPLVMGSRSTCIKADIGGLNGRAIRSGDRIGLRVPGKGAGQPARQAPKDFGPAYTAFPEIRFTFGPQDDMFSESGKELFVREEYVIDLKSDRMGFRLNGPEIERAEGSSGNIISDGVCFGSIQVTNGQPIVMMADRQTAGGYPKIGCAISADLPLLAQLKGGDRVRFCAVSVEQAQEAYINQLKQLSELEKSFAKQREYREQEYLLTVGNKTYTVSIRRT